MNQENEDVPAARRAVRGAGKRVIGRRQAPGGRGQGFTDLELNRKSFFFFLSFL